MNKQLYLFHVYAVQVSPISILKKLSKPAYIFKKNTCMWKMGNWYIQITASALYTLFHHQFVFTSILPDS